MLDQRLRRGQTNQRLRVEICPWSLSWRSILYTPARWCVDRQYRNIGILHGRNDVLEGVAHFATKAEAKDGVYNMMGGFQ